MRWHSAGMREVPREPTWHDPALAARLASMRFTKRRDEAELGRWTAKQALARARGIDPSDPASLRRIVVRNAPDGAPEAFIDDLPAGMRIAMTDRADWAVCAVVAGGGDIGCDMELVEPRSDAFVRDYFTSAEQRLVAAAPSHALAANLVWSAKESALKVLRTGLRRDTRSVEVTVEIDESEGRWRPLHVIDRPAGERFPGYWIRHGEFLLTVAGRTSRPAPVSFTEPPPLAAAVPSHDWLLRPR